MTDTNESSANKTSSKSSAKKITKRRQAPGRTLEAREKQLVHLAIDLAEKQIRSGQASSQVITHFLKLGSVTEDLARQKTINENKLLQAKTDALASAKKIEELYAQALSAMREYGGHTNGHLSDDDVDD